MSEKKKTSRERLEAAVTRIGKAYETLVRTVEKDADEIDDQMIQKAFGYMGGVHASAMQKALLSVAANAGFSLDKDYETTANPASAPAPLPASPQPINLTPHSGAVRPEGRLVGHKKQPAAREVVREDDEDGVGFIDD